jgi:hypothetical protein
MDGNVNEGTAVTKASAGNWVSCTAGYRRTAHPFLNASDT